MGILKALFGNTEEFKQKTRRQIQMWLIPLRAVEYIVGPGLALFFTIQTYMREVPKESNVEFTAYVLGSFIVFGLYGRFMKWLRGWETNKRVKYLAITGVKFLPFVSIAILLNVMAQDAMVFIQAVESIVYCYMASYVVGYFAEPLAAELRVRDKIRFNTEQGRVVD